MKTTITIEDDVWREITQLKLDCQHETLNDTIKYLLFSLNKHNEKKED